MRRKFSALHHQRCPPVRSASSCLSAAHRQCPPFRFLVSQCCPPSVSAVPFPRAAVLPTVSVRRSASSCPSAAHRQCPPFRFLVPQCCPPSVSAVPLPRASVLPTVSVCSVLFFRTLVLSTVSDCSVSTYPSAAHRQCPFRPLRAPVLSTVSVRSVSPYPSAVHRQRLLRFSVPQCCPPSVPVPFLRVLKLRARGR